MIQARDKPQQSFFIWYFSFSNYTWSLKLERLPSLHHKGNNLLMNNINQTHNLDLDINYLIECLLLELKL